MGKNNINLVHTFTIIGALCIVIILLVVGYIISSYHSHNMIQIAINNTAESVKRLIKSELSDKERNFSIFNIDILSSKNIETLSHFHDLILSLPNIARYKIYNQQKEIIMSDEKRLIGKKFIDNPRLDQALSGEVTTEYSIVNDSDNIYEKDFRETELLEIYVPIISKEKEVVAVVKVYKTTQSLMSSINHLRTVVWIVISGGGLVLYLSLLVLVYRSYNKQISATSEARRLSVVNEVSKSVNSSLDLKVVYETIIEQLKKVFSFTFSSNIALYDSEKDIFNFSNLYDPMGKIADILRDNQGSPSNSLILSNAFMGKRINYIPDATKLSSEKKMVNQFIEKGIRSFVNVPLIIEQKCIGTLNLSSSNVDSFSHKEIELLETISSHLAIAINNANIYAGLEKTNREMAFINDIMDLLKRPSDISQVLRETLDKVLGFVDLTGGGIFLLNETGEELHNLVHSPAPADYLEEIKILSVKDSLSGYVARTGESQYGNNFINHPHGNIPTAKKYGFKGFAIVPIKNKDKVLGTISIASIDEGRIVSKDDVRLLETLARQVGVTLENFNLQLKREQMENSLRESEEHKGAILKSALDCIISIDGEGRIIEFNPAAEKTFGYERAEMMGEKVIEMVIPPYLRETFYQNEARYRSTGDTTFINKRIETTGLRADESEFPVELTITPLRLDEDHELTVFLRDITERKRAEEEKQRLEALLKRAEKMEAIGNLAGGVAHDLNNILSGLVSFPQLLLLDIPEDSPLRESLEIIKGSGEKATAIVQDLLTLARRGTPITEVVDLNSIILEYLDSPEYKKLIAYHPLIEVETNFEAGLFNILGSPVHLNQAVMNLVSNATEAIPDRGKIIISTENQYVDRPISGYDEVEEGDYVVFKISDSGIGIAPEDIEKIFEPFYTKKKLGISGTGLGMTVVWGTVKDHHGYIDVKSVLGKGSAITIHFPRTKEELVEVQSNLSIEDYRANGQSILVVDDAGEQRKLAFELLNRLGYSVTTVSSGEKAVEYLHYNQVDLIVLDMIMDPGMDGLDTYKQILKLYPDQKAVISSGFTETARVKEAQELGAGTYIKKPYTLEKLSVSVFEELRR